MHLVCCCLQVAAPRPLPGGSQVQIFDLEGFKLSMVNGELITLFKVRGICSLWCCGAAVAVAAVIWLLYGVWVPLR